MSVVCMYWWEEVQQATNEIVLVLDGVVNKGGAKWQYNEFGQPQRKKQDFLHNV